MLELSKRNLNLSFWRKSGSDVEWYPANHKDTRYNFETPR